MDPLWVVLVHWNQHCDLLSTLDAFCQQGLPVRFVVVDNDSRPEELAGLKHGLDALRAAGTSIQLLEMDHNAGFGPGANAGLHAYMDHEERSQWVVLAPHDVDPAPGTLSTMLAAALDRPMAGLMCADVGDGMSPVIDPYFGGMIVPGSPEPGWQEVDYPHGTLMMLKGAMLDEVGVFDPRYFSYCEEADLALRSRERGWEIGLVRGAMVKNLNLGSSVKRVDYLQTRNTLLLVRENSGRYHAFIRICFTLAQIVRGLRRPESRPPVFDARARTAGIRDFLLGRFGPPPADL